MAMSSGSSAEDMPMSDINTTPLVDVMLVLLIIFLITVPVVVQNIKLKLPDVRYDPTQTKPENVSLSITANGGTCQVYWGTSPITSKELYERAYKKLDADIKRLKAAGTISPDDLPEVHIRGDVSTPYRCIGGAIFQMQSAGFQKVGFISEPPPQGGPSA
ncbi:ExbD/TolR family protein [uncultured Sphingomonas sp.]|uniref:ExbD/TolR family protein n=1 Tax=uncultured Sphingomonas sp. TaxID=158754 RepID=UPI0035CBEFDE